MFGPVCRSEAEELVLAIQLDDVPGRHLRLLELGRPRRQCSREIENEFADPLWRFALNVPAQPAIVGG